MTLKEFEASDGKEFSGALLALWWDARGDWDRAHQVAQDAGGRDGAWVHAYLHRKEGAVENAAYWYGQARKPVQSGELRGEWKSIVVDLLSRR
jgi:hypothetical protein